jgi:class 3 adenylate cyclase
MLLSPGALPYGRPQVEFLDRSKSKTPPPAPRRRAPKARGPTLDARKTVTILFTDIVDSSRLSLALDPEALRNLLARYFGELSAVVRRHGGMVEK